MKRHKQTTLSTLAKEPASDSIDDNCCSSGARISGDMSLTPLADLPLPQIHQVHLTQPPKVTLLRTALDQRCLSLKAQCKHNNTFDDILLLNEYPEHLIKEIRRTKLSTINNSPIHGGIHWYYLQMPYISDALESRLQVFQFTFSIPDFPINQNAQLGKETFFTSKMS